MSLPKNRDPNKTNSLDVVAQNLIEQEATRCALLTGIGRSAVAVVAIRGPQAADALARCFHPASKRPFSRGEIRFGLWRGVDASGDGEAVVVTPLDEATFEVHCHGGPAAITRIIDDLRGLGVQRCDPAEWSTSPEVPLVIAEAMQVLSACQTSRTAAIALDQVRGAMLHWAVNWKARVSAQANSVIDLLHREIDTMLADAEFGMRLTEPFRVVLSGPPNVGKSSLVNAIVGYDRSITQNIAGTTRDVLHAETVIDGIPIRLSDTAGIRESAEPIEREGVARARAAVQDADLLIWVQQPTAERTSDRTAENRTLTTRSLHVLNKADLLTDPHSAEESPGCEKQLLTVATLGIGIDRLMSEMVAKLVQRFPEPGNPVPLNARQRDCLQQALSDETPRRICERLDRLVDGQQPAR